MRLLISCTKCQRRYDAGGREVGTRFRCRCGEVLSVRRPKGHVSSVVRCSSCGGARDGDSRYCRYCRSDFTLHEQDLHTVCPHCLARVSDRAKFCSQCGDSLSSEGVAGDETPAICPFCPEEAQQKLFSRVLGGQNLNVLECQICAGLWIGIDSFNALRRRVAGQSADIDVLFPGGPKPRRLRPQTGPLYRKCVLCTRLMSRRQYARGSGVIIDVCREHGIWFDPEELHQVVTWIAEGGRTQRPITPLDRSEPTSGEKANRHQGGREHPGDGSVWFDVSGNFLDVLLSGVVEIW